MRSRRKAGTGRARILTRKIRKQALAESDLTGIWEYTFGKWGEAKADKYLDELEAGIALLARDAELGSSRDRIRKGYRVLFVNRHAVYYTVTPEAIQIVRVLHGQMDPEQRL